MAELPAFLHFWTGMTPADFWALPYAEYQALRQYMKAWQQEEKNQWNQIKSRR